jgi:DNA-binding SARP family transcriptional activator/tetratricopeptide (TPR) repeat protein
VRFRILGPLWIGGGELEVTAGRDRIVLAMLLLHPNRIVSVDELVDAVWPDDPPATARGQLQTCVSRLRRMLGPETIQTDPAGYASTIAPEDATVFTRLIAQARTTTDPDEARRHFRAALALWRGPALTGIDSRAVRQSAAVLDEQHAIATEDWVDLELGGGRDRDLVTELAALVDRFPLRERLRGQLIRALQSAGRPTEAVAEYDRIEAALRDEVGVEPSPELRAIRAAIELGEAEPAAIRSLPRAVSDFTGREAVVRRLLTAIDEAGDGPVLQVIDGMPGVGKSALAVHVAGLAGSRFPDAHLFIDLHGHGDGPATDPAAALVTLLRQFGVAPDRIPVGLDDRVARWRSELAGRRTIVVLDNAGSSAQVIPLLPGNGDHVVLVTSRRRLTGLDGVRPESVEVLAQDEAVDLFGRIVGDRAGAEPDAVIEVVRRCGRLPLAIRLAAARLAHRPGWRVADLLRRLGEATLPGLAAEDRTVAAAFALSYGQLPVAQQRMFRLLGLFPGDRFRAAAAAALADLPLGAAEDLIDALVDVHLVEEPETGRFRLHDLLREYAAAVEAPDDRRASALRLFDHVLHATATLSRPMESTASILTARFREPIRPDLGPATTDPVAFLDEERGNLLAVSRSAQSWGAHEVVWQLARAGWALWLRHGYHDDLIDAHERAMASARILGDDSALGIVANYLAAGYHHVARMDAAADVLEVAYESLDRAGNRPGATAALSNLALVRYELGDIDAAAVAADAALADRRRRQDVGGLPLSLINMGRVAARRGRLAESLRWQRLNLLLSGETAASPTQRYVALSHVAIARMRLGHPAAERLLRLAIVLDARVRNKTDEAAVTSALGIVRRRQGRFGEAIALHRRALDLVGEIKERRQVSDLQMDLAGTLFAAGDRAAATVLFGEAGALAAATQHRHEQARSLAGLAECVAADDPELARSYRDRAAAMFREMGVAPVADIESGVDQLRASEVGSRMEG